MTLAVDHRARELRAALVRSLEAGGYLTDPRWKAAFETVPRHAFVPEFWTLVDGTRRHITSSDAAWLELAYTDDALATQLTGEVATSSSTAPSLMAAMLQALDAAEGHRVLEIATGTGYNAALLAERLGSRSVTTIEVDPDLADLAEKRLLACGYTPTVLTGDGRVGHPDGAPYDGLIATCGFTTVPCAWLEQVRPGGVIVCPLGGGTARLVVGGDGTAEGSFLPGPSYFMAVRDAGATGAVAYPGTPETTTDRPTSLAPGAPFTGGAFPFLLSLAVPGVGQASELDAEGQVIACQMWGADGSWARVENGTVRQAGPRLLWDAVEHAHARYEEYGRPGRGRFGLTLTPTGQRVWLDSPGGPGWTMRGEAGLA